jgi:cytochrome c-type biogenesis protein CcmH/NrfG
MAPIELFSRRPQAARAALLRLASRADARAVEAELWHSLGATLLALGDRGGALNAFRNAASLDGARSATQLALGNLLFDSGRFDLALRCFENVARMPLQE